MLGLIFNDDGSIFDAALPKYVTQGSSGNLDSLKICVAFKDSDITDEGTTVICRFRLPDGTKNDITLFNNGTFEFQSTEYNCKYGYLTADQTLYEGILLVSIEVLTDVGSNILYTYNARITVNPTTYDPTSDYTNINNAQYENLATQIENLQYRGASKQYVNELVTHQVFDDVSVAFDDIPTINSTNAVKSGGVYSWVNLRIGLETATAITRAKREALDAAHPIGSIYMSLDPTDPHDLFGGTWERIQGRFLLGAGSNDANTDNTFGSMTQGQIDRETIGEKGGRISHDHDAGSIKAKMAFANGVLYGNCDTDAIASHNRAYIIDGATATTPEGTWATGPLVNTQGRTDYAYNLPPYYVVYMWKRVADPVEE